MGLELERPRRHVPRSFPGVTTYHGYCSSNGRCRASSALRIRSGPDSPILPCQRTQRSNRTPHIRCRRRSHVACGDAMSVARSRSWRRPRPRRWTLDGTVTVPRSRRRCAYASETCRVAAWVNERTLPYRPNGCERSSNRYLATGT